MDFSDGISLLALAIACASLFYSLRKDDNARQIRVIERKHQLFRLYDQCAESARAARMYLPAIANVMSPNDWRNSEQDMRAMHHDLEIQEEDFRNLGRRVSRLRFGEQKETHWRHVNLEELVEGTNNMLAGLEKMRQRCEEKYYQELAKRQAEFRNSADQSNQ